jgi:hypothetical protein
MFLSRSPFVQVTEYLALELHVEQFMLAGKEVRKRDVANR